MTQPHAKTIQSRVLGTMKQNSDYGGFEATDIPIPFFDNQKMPIIFADVEIDEPAVVERYEQTIENF